jgi:hypothetical protein
LKAWYRLLQVLSETKDWPAFFTTYERFRQQTPKAYD